MTHDQFITLRDVLIQACESHLQNGGRVINRYFSMPDNSKECCPLFCLLGNVNGLTGERLSELLEFDVQASEVSSFIYSFDQYPIFIERMRNKGTLSQQMADLGQELYTTYVKPGEEFRKSVATNTVKE